MVKDYSFIQIKQNYIKMYTSHVFKALVRYSQEKKQEVDTLVLGKLIAPRLHVLTLGLRRIGLPLPHPLLGAQQIN